jgi:hypothetical protein
MEINGEMSECHAGTVRARQGYDSKLLWMLMRKHWRLGAGCNEVIFLFCILKSDLKIHGTFPSEFSFHESLCLRSF